MDRQSLSRQPNSRVAKAAQLQHHDVYDASEGDDYGLRRDRGFYLNQGQGRQRWIEQGLGQEGFERSRYSDRSENYRSGYRQAPVLGEGGEGYGGPVDRRHGHAVEGYGGQSGYGADVFEARSGVATGLLRSDAGITEEAREMLADNPSLDARDIDVACFQGLVTLQGTVPDARMRHLAENLIAYCQGVRHVRNRLTVGSAYTPSSTGSRSFNGENA